MNEVKVLPSDVWVEILRRIPTADLLPLKAVCKTFHRLISDDFFTRLHLNHLTKLHPKATKAIIVTDLGASHSHYEPYKRTISVWHNNEPRFDDFTRVNHLHRVIDSCHGLLLIQVRARLLLYNPITRSHKLLPSICDFWELDGWKIAYNDVTEQYKVFSLKIWSKNMFSHLYVFDVHRDEELHYPRQKKACDSPTKVGQICRDTVLVNGSVYWLFMPIDPETLNRENIMTTHIISVNVTTEEVKNRSCSIARQRQPQLYAANETFYRLETLRHPNDNLTLWVLEGIESENPNPSWKMKHILDTNHLTSTPSITPNFDILVGGMFCNKVLIIMSSIICPDRIFQYDMSSKEFEEVMVASSGNNIGEGIEFKNCRIIGHIDSLISPSVTN